MKTKSASKEALKQFIATSEEQIAFALTLLPEASDADVQRYGKKIAKLQFKVGKAREELAA